MNFNFSSKCSSLKVILTLNNVLKSLCFCEKFESWANGHKYFKYKLGNLKAFKLWDILLLHSSQRCICSQCLK